MQYKLPKDLNEKFQFPLHFTGTNQQPLSVDFDPHHNDDPLGTSGTEDIEIFHLEILVWLKYSPNSSLIVEQVMHHTGFLSNKIETLGYR